MPGIGVKRWLALVLVGELALALAGAFVLKQIYRDIILPGPLEGVVYVLTLQFLPYGARALPLLVAGVAVFLVAVVKLAHTLLLPFGDPSGPLVEVIYQKRYLARGSARRRDRRRHRALCAAARTQGAHEQHHGRGDGRR